MKERPILMNGAMVRATLDGSKTQTRRVVKLPSRHSWSNEYDGAISYRDNTFPLDELCCPFGRIGDYLWVREAFAETRIHQSAWPATTYVYRECDNRTDYGGPWKPSIHMPRAASRITLKIVSVRVERLNDISIEDAKAEGCAGGHGSIKDYMYNASPDEHFMCLWESINGEGSWNANPWVWVIEFKVVKP